MKIFPIPAFADNYIWLVQGTSYLAVVDPGAAGPVVSVLENMGADLDAILLTHHHSDHVGGVQDLRAKYNVKVYGPDAEKDIMPPLDVCLFDHNTFILGDDTFNVIKTPGHTLGHICYFSEPQKVLFSGDTLFSLGCGRLFEGTAEQMYESLQKLKNLPEETKLYCGHEYTLSNAAFAQSVDPDNAALKQRIQDVKALRAEGKPSLPVTMQEEKQTNPFLLAKSPGDFAELRKKKDSF